MSDRKAELERKRKRLEEIKKAREEKKKVRNLEDEISGLYSILNFKGRQLSDFEDWIETALVFLIGCIYTISIMHEKLILNGYIGDFLCGNT